MWVLEFCPVVTFGRSFLVDFLVRTFRAFIRVTKCSKIKNNKRVPGKNNKRRVEPLPRSLHTGGGEKGRAKDLDYILLNQNDTTKKHKYITTRNGLSRRRFHRNVLVTLEKETLTLLVSIDRPLKTCFSKKRYRRILKNTLSMLRRDTYLIIYGTHGR